MSSEAWFAWRERVPTDDGERLLVPEADPMRYEQSFDLLFANVDDAITAYLDHFEGAQQPTNWCLVTLAVREVATAEQAIKWFT